MKANLLSSLFAGAVLVLGTGLAIPAAVAGPGPEYWRNLGKTPERTPAASVSSSTVSMRCTDARVVPITETKSILPNGRGPTRTVEVGRKVMCTSCDAPLVVMKPSGHNGRGAMMPVAIKGSHDCAKSGCNPSTASLE